MIKELTITLEPQTHNNFDQNVGSIFQGVLMETIDSDYATYLHNSQLHPYSQYVLCNNDKNELMWRISALDKTTCDEILPPLYELQSFYLKKKDCPVHIKSREFTRETTYEELIETHMAFGSDVKGLKFNFLTTTTFKSDGTYINFPSTYYVMNSLYKKWLQCAPDRNLENLVDIMDLTSALSFNKYNLRTKPFHVERQRIPGFVGSLELSIRNPSVGFLCCLLGDFANHSGIGIKTGIGMGATVVSPIL